MCNAPARLQRLRETQAIPAPASPSAGVPIANAGNTPRGEVALTSAGAVLGPRDPMPNGAPESPTILITNPSPPRDIVSTSRMPTAIAMPVRKPASATWCGSAKTALTRRRWAVTSVTAWECGWPAYTIACWAARTSSRESRIAFLYQAIGIQLALATHGSSQARQVSKAGVPYR